MKEKNPTFSDGGTGLSGSEGAAPKSGDAEQLNVPECTIDNAERSGNAGEAGLAAEYESPKNTAESWPAVPTPGERISELEAELAAERDRALRLQAETANFRRRMEKERENWHQAIVKDVAVSFLEPMDSLMMAVDNAAKAARGDASDAEKHILGLIDGVKLAIGQIEDRLKANKVEEFNPAGELFDPKLHEAFGMIDNAELPDGHVAAVLRRGYRMGDQVIRPPLVQVSRKPKMNADDKCQAKGANSDDEGKKDGGARGA